MERIGNHMDRLLKTPVFLASALVATGFMAMGATSVARPGTVNYAEGTVSVGGKTVGAPQLGHTEVEPGQILSTDQGKAEMLLTPGVLLRIGNNSAVRMVSPSLTDTRVELLRGEALVEAAQVRDQNRIGVIEGGYETLIEKKGIYQFDADRREIAVYDGKAKVLDNDRPVEVGKGKTFALGVDEKPRKFDRDQTGDLYAWSKLRSGYLAEANEAAIGTINVTGPAWYGTGWYWSPWYRTWAFVPADGYLASPFGFSFYSPSYWYSMGPVYTYPYYRPVYPGRVWSGPRGGVIRGGGAPMRVPHGVPSGRSLGRGARM
jgi:hypothetical protein